MKPQNELLRKLFIIYYLAGLNKTLELVDVMETEIQ